MPVVLEAVAFRPTRRQRQDRIQAVLRLYRRLLVGGKDGGVLRGIEIQPDDVRRLLIEVRVVREHVVLHPMRLEASAPHTRDKHMTEAEHLRQFLGTPARTSVRRRLVRLREDPRFHGWRAHRRGLSPIARFQAGKSLHLKPLLPAHDVRWVAVDGVGDRFVRCATGQHQNDPGSPCIFRAPLAAPASSFEFDAFIRRHTQRCMALSISLSIQWVQSKSNHRRPPGPAGEGRAGNRYGFCLGKNLALRFGLLPSARPDTFESPPLRKGNR